MRRVANRMRGSVTPPGRDYPLVDRLEPRTLLSGGSAPATVAAVDSVGPDLTVQFKRPPRGSFVGGSAAQATIVVTNARGGGEAPPSAAALYLSADGVLDAADRPLASATAARPLKPGDRVGVRFSRVTLPADLPSGTYHLLARADDTGAVAEADETNNVADGGTITLHAPVVDIVPVAQKTTLYYAKGSALGGWAKLCVRNNGNADYRGPVTVTVVVPGMQAYRWTFTEEVSLKRGKMTRVNLPLAHYAWARHGTMIPYLFTAAGHHDVTPGEQLAGLANVIDRAWR